MRRSTATSYAPTAPESEPDRGLPRVPITAARMLASFCSTAENRPGLSSVAIYRHGGLAATDGHRAVIVAPVQGADWGSDSWGPQNLAGRIDPAGLKRLTVACPASSTVSIGIKTAWIRDRAGEIVESRPSYAIDLEDADVAVSGITTFPCLQKITAAATTRVADPAASLSVNASYLHDAFLFMARCSPKDVNHTVEVVNRGELDAWVATLETSELRALIATMPVRR